MNSPVWCPAFRLSGLAFLLAALTLAAGCGKPQKAPVAGGVTGYICPTCKTKFYVEEGVVADLCPRCKGTAVQPIVGYVCATDGHVTLNIRRSRLLPCEQCGVQTTSVRRPTAAELEAFGAAKKSKAEICRNSS